MLSAFLLTIVATTGSQPPTVTAGNPAALAPLSAPFPKDPLRDYIRIPAGRYLVTEPVVIEPGVAYLGGQPYHTRGWGPHLDLRGVTLVVSPDFVGDTVLEVVGTHPIIEGLMIDARWSNVKYGAMFMAKVVDGKSQASGGRGSWTSGGIIGKFSVSALYMEGAEEISFRDWQIVNQGTGVGVTIANDRLIPGWSQTVTLFDGCSFQIYGNDAVKMEGQVYDTAFTDCFFATKFNVVDGRQLTGRRNYLDRCRVEGSASTVIVRGATATVFSRGNAVLNVSPLVSAFQVQPPYPANTLDRVGLVTE